MPVGVAETERPWPTVNHHPLSHPDGMKATGRPRSRDAANEALQNPPSNLSTSSSETTFPDWKCCVQSMQTRRRVLRQSWAGGDPVLYSVLSICDL